LLFASQVACDRWAVIYCGSRDFYNYRHTADSYYMHYLVRIENKLPKDRMILMCYDNIVDSPQNPFKGQIFRSLDHKNIYPGKDEIAYSGAATTAKNFYNVLLGDTSAGRALQSTENDNVMVFFDNHGGDGILGVPEGCGPYIYAKDLKNVLQQMYEKKMYKNLFFPITACYSGSVAKVVDGVPKLYMMTASNDHESSYACLYDSSLGTYLSSEFSVVSQLYWEAHPTCTIGESFEPIRTGVKQSHVCRYGDMSLEALPVSDFLGLPNSVHRVRSIPAAAMIIKSSETTARLSQLEVVGVKKNSFFQARIAAEVALEQEADKKVNALISGLKNKFTTDANFELPCANINWDSYKLVLGHLQAKFDYLGESFYAKTRFFSNLCNVAPAEAIIKAIDSLL